MHEAINTCFDSSTDSSRRSCLNIVWLTETRICDVYIKEENLCVGVGGVLAASHMPSRASIVIPIVRL
jgi:hypothetical protein